MSKTCPSCGYQPIGPFTDNCPICAEPVRNVRSDNAGGFGRVANLPPLLVGGWIVIGLVLAYLFWSDFPWLLLSLILCGAAWWGVAQGTPLLRWLGGSLLVLFIPGIWLAAQASILPGLDRREMSQQRLMSEVMAMVQGTSPETLRTRARMKTISGFTYALHATVAVPLALVVPPLLNHRRRRKLGGPIFLSKPQAIAGLVVWLLLLPALGWLAWPAMRSWAEAPNNQINWPAGPWPGGRQPVEPDEPAQPG
jgi:hypothetical protein